MTQIPLNIIRMRVDKETALANSQTYIEKNPDFQRTYESWDDKLRTRFIETILCGRAMNPIWTILNPMDNCEDVLDGMHRLTTAIDFMNNKFKLAGEYFMEPQKKESLHGKTFKELSFEDQNRVRNYNFMFNQLDSSYRTDLNKLRDQYEILNRSSKPLNTYELNKVLYNPFFDLISKHKEELKTWFIDKKDKRGAVDTEIIEMFVLSYDLPGSWSSIRKVCESFYTEQLGETEQSVRTYLTENTEEIKGRLLFMKKVVATLKDNKFFSEEPAIYKKYYLPYKFIISRLIHKIKDIATLNRNLGVILPKLKEEVAKVDDYTNRNASFQRSFIQSIDQALDECIRPEKRLFTKTDIARKLQEQGGVCNICRLAKEKYEGDHIVEWTNGGDTNYENLQVLCKRCHYIKTSAMNHV
jgi:hypothetical protein